jgi:hypothetical protein
MLGEIGKLFLEDLIGESLRGLFQRSRSPMSRRLKTAAWLCLIASIASFMVAARWPCLNSIRPDVAVAAGLTATVATFSLGFWASVVNARNERPGRHAANC